MRDRWGELHLVVPDEAAGKYDDREILETYERTYSRIDLAMVLWRLIGGEDQARQIEAVMSRAYERDVPTLDERGIADLLDAVVPLPAALRRDLQLGAHDRLTMAQVEQLRERTDKLDLEESRGDAVIHAIEEAIGEVDGLTEILRRAEAERAHIIFN
jgi:hypothetical protein